MRNYFVIEKTDDGIFLSEGKGTDSPDDYDYTKNWYEPEEMTNEEMLFNRIKELLNKEK